MELNPVAARPPAILRPRFAWILPVLYLVIGSALIGAVGTAPVDRSATDQLPDGYDSTEVVRLLEDFPSGDGQVAVVLFSADEALDPAASQAVADVFARVAGQGAVPLQASEDGTALVGVLPMPSTDAAELADDVDKLRAAVREGLPDGVRAEVTGPAAIQGDLARVFEGADVTLLIVTASVVALLLIITYRSPVLWLVPLLVVGIADQVAAVTATHALTGLGVAFDQSTTGILSVLVFGAGTDYALLLISRYRDELHRTPSRPEAMARAWRRTAEAVLASAATVVVALLALLLSAFPTTRGLGLACAIGVVVAAGAVLVVLPLALVGFPRGIFWPRRPVVGEPTLSEGRSAWRRIGDAVARRPLWSATAGMLLLAVLASGALGIRSGLSEADQFIDTPESIAAASRLAESFPAGSADPAVVLTRDDADTVVAAAESADGVASARVVGEHDGRTRVDVVLDHAPGTPQAQADLASLRTALADLPDTLVGGTDAENVDSDAAARDDRALVLPVILLVVLLALGLLLRALVAPVVLVLTVVATYLAALGAGWLISHTVFGFDRLDVGVPLQAFLFLVALGVDYNIFLVARAAEEAEEHGAREGMLRALAATGGVITSAGVLLAAVFAVLGVLPLVVLAQLGIVICVGVLLDTLLVRTVLVPALALRLGDRFWWPRRQATRSSQPAAR
ncbi:MMPL family transporter [Nocardioides nitrophenolicus]|uniref:MMPL family transporter n=1 Tax=Nocardioides nitrophenolicus TaxID=60489 RepID=UPI0019582A6F|nr:MMPL family transporter [Nocardioides nitrophenolicus]MBM7516630.1 RND superfamily putative drug exporter [Nocardioides nitrophenolicus]